SAFRSHFIGAQVCLIPKESLANVTQKDDESVKDYIARFNDRVQNMEPCHPETLLVMAIAGLKPNSIFRWTICQNKPNTFQEFLARAQQHIIAEEAMSVPDFNFNLKPSKAGTDEKKKNKYFERQNKTQFRGPPRGDPNDPEVRAARKQYATDVKSGYQTVYSAGAATIYEEIKGKGILPDPKPLRMPEEKLDKSRYYDYHKSPGHNTDECLSLLAALLRLIGHPQLRKFYCNTDPQRRGPGRQIEPFDEDDEEDRGAMPKRIRQGDKEVFMFTSETPDSDFTGTARGRKRGRSPEPMQITVHRVNTNNSRSTLSRRQIKAYARQAYNSSKQVYTTDLRDILNNRNCSITFNMEDANHFAHPHSDALVITVPICGIPVHRVMVDTGAYSSILMLKAFDKMGLDPADIRPCNDQIQGFNGSISKPIGEITLPVRFGTLENVTKLVMETFKILDINNEYNAIIGRTTLYKLRAAVLIFHYALKFPTTRGEGTHFGDQREARELITFIPSSGVHSTSTNNSPSQSVSNDTASEEPNNHVSDPSTSDPLTEDRGRR
ncbi:Unknown protein, partial [Striga hermonthica]